MPIIPFPVRLCCFPVYSVYSGAVNLVFLMLFAIMEVNGVEEPLRCMPGYFGVVSGVWSTIVVLMFCFGLLIFETCLMTLN